MKHISTLVKDIYGLLETGAVKLDANRLASMISSKLSNAGPGAALRMSTLGEKCLRKLWYREHAPEKAEALPGRVVFSFLFGDILEEIVLALAEQAGHKVEGRQDELDLHGIKGHRDAVIDDVLVDVKSANSRSMDKFKTHALERDDPFGYLAQLGAYAEAGEHRAHAFLAVDKELGHLVLDQYPIKKVDWKKKIEEIRDVLSKDVPPSRAYTSEPDGKSGNKQLPLPCRYCQFKNTCWPGLRTFIYSSGPRYLTHVERTPDVPEATINTQTQDSRRSSLEETNEKVS